MRALASRCGRVDEGGGGGREEAGVGGRRGGGEGNGEVVRRGGTGTFAMGQRERRVGAAAAAAAASVAVDGRTAALSLGWCGWSSCLVLLTCELFFSLCLSSSFLCSVLLFFICCSLLLSRCKRRTAALQDSHTQRIATAHHPLVHSHPHLARCPATSEKAFHHVHTARSSTPLHTALHRVPGEVSSTPVERARTAIPRVMGIHGIDTKNGDFRP